LWLVVEVQEARAAVEVGEVDSEVSLLYLYLEQITV
jgi:hypothetical protein